MGLIMKTIVASRLFNPPSILVIASALAVRFWCATAQSANAQVSLTGNSYSQDFDSMGSSSGSNLLPTGWLFSDVDAGSPAPGGAAYSAGDGHTTRGAGTTGINALSSSSAGGAYVMVNGVLAIGADKAIGYLSSGSFVTNRDVLFGFTNNTGQTISSLTFTWDYEKYRNGTPATDWTFFTSLDGIDWGSAIPDGAQSYATDGNTLVLNPPITTSTKSVTLSGLSLAAGSS